MANKELHDFTEVSTLDDLSVYVVQIPDGSNWLTRSVAWGAIKTLLAAVFAPIAKGVTNGDSHDHSGGDGAQIDHGGLAGLADDDHSQYHNDSRGDARYLYKENTAAFTPDADYEPATKKYVDENGGAVNISGTPEALDFARFTDADTIEGRSYAEVRSDLNVTDGAEVNPNLMSQAEAEAGTETAERVINAAVQKAAVIAHAPAGGSLIAKNKITNGAMQIAQQGASTAGITTSGYPAGGPDLVYLGINDCGTITVSQGSGFAAQGFGDSYKISWTTAKAALSAGSYARLEWRLAGQNLQNFKKGLAGAEQFATGVWMKATKTGTYIVELVDADNTRHASTTITIAASNTAEEQEIIFPADTTGALDNNNAKSLTLRIWLAAGTNFTSGTLATVWASETDANRAVGQVNAADSASNYVEITGLGLYVGDSVPEFEHCDIKETLNDVIGAGFWLSPTTYIFTGYVQSGSNYYLTVPHPVPMRTTPTASWNITSSGQFDTTTKTTYAAASDKFKTTMRLTASATNAYGYYTVIPTLDARL